MKKRKFLKFIDFLTLIYFDIIKANNEISIKMTWKQLPISCCNLDIQLLQKSKYIKDICYCAYLTINIWNSTN